MSHGWRRVWPGLHPTLIVIHCTRPCWLYTHTHTQREYAGVSARVVISLMQMHCGFSVSVYACINPGMCECVDVQHGCQAPERPNHSSATRADQLTRSQSRQTWRGSGRHHYAAQRAVCPDPVWGPLLSLILMSSPGFRFTGAQRPCVGGGGCQRWHQYTPTNICPETRGPNFINRETSEADCSNISPSILV